MNRSFTCIILTLSVLVSVIILGCSGNATRPLAPDDKPVVSSISHTCWGLWQFAADPA